MKKMQMPWGGRCTTTKTVHHETTNYTDQDSGLEFMRR